MLRRQEKCVRVVERVQRSGDVGHRHVKGGRLTDLLLSLSDFGVPIQTVKLWVVVVLPHVVPYDLQHPLARSRSRLEICWAHATEAASITMAIRPAKHTTFFSTNMANSWRSQGTEPSRRCRTGCSESILVQNLQLPQRLYSKGGALSQSIRARMAGCLSIQPPPLQVFSTALHGKKTALLR